jgi:hypothetical protein
MRMNNPAGEPAFGPMRYGINPQPFCKDGGQWVESFKRVLIGA